HDVCSGMALGREVRVLGFFVVFFFFFQAEDGIRDYKVTGVQTCALPISIRRGVPSVRLMVGATGEEFNVTAAATPGGVDEARLERRLGRMGLGPDAIAAYRTSMPGAEPWRVLGQAVTDSTFKVPAIRLADAWAGGGGSVHAYDFEWRTGVGDMGAVHCLDIPFAFDNLDASGVE